MALKKILLACLFSLLTLNGAPIHDACVDGKIGKVRAFLADGENVNIQNRRFHQTPLHIAIYNEHNDIAKLLIEKGADVNAEMINGQTPLFLAAYFGDLDLVKLLIKKGADVKHQDKKGNTPLHKAAEGGNAEVIKLLLSYDVDINAQNIDGDTPLHIAGFMGNEEAVWALVKSGADATIVNNEEYTPIDEADEEDYGRIVKIMQKYAK